MKFDLVSAWKNESYRATLSEEELGMLPANPVGELSEAELAKVIGGDMPDSAAAAAAAATSSTNTLGMERHTHSYAVICDINIFSDSIRLLEVTNLFSIGNCSKQICFGRD
jgi:mersacidin/lichenicidin family type 2 lantibiotic